MSWYIYDNVLFFPYQNHIVQYTEKGEEFCLMYYKKRPPTRLDCKLHQGQELHLSQPLSPVTVWE